MTHTATAREVEALTRMGLTWPRPTPDRPPRSAARRPLGLRPVEGSDDDGDDRAASSARRDIGEEVESLVRTAMELLGGEAACRATAATTFDEFQTLGTALKIAMEGDDDLHRAWKAKHAETSAEIAALKLENAH